MAVRRLSPSEAKVDQEQRRGRGKGSHAFRPAAAITTSGSSPNFTDHKELRTTRPPLCAPDVALLFVVLSAGWKKNCRQDELEATRSGQQTLLTTNKVSPPHCKLLPPRRPPPPTILRTTPPSRPPLCAPSSRKGSSARDRTRRSSSCTPSRRSSGSGR